MRIAIPTFSLNPILVKELRGRMRGPRAFLFLTGVLVLLGLVAFGLFQLAAPRYAGPFGQTNVAAGAMIGQTVFVGLVFLTLLLVCAIAPSLTAGAISDEHQRKTFDLLMATPLAPITILSGKLGAALSYLVLILLAALPITSLAYVFGGVTIADLFKAFVVILGFGIAFSVMGLFFSALYGRTGLAVGTSYFLLGFVVLGTLFVYAVVGVMRGEQPPTWMLALNPFSAMASTLMDGIITDPNSVYGSGSPMTPLLWGLAGGSFDGNLVLSPPLWQYTAAVYGTLTLVLFLLATQLLKPVQRFRFGKMGWLILILIILLVIAGAAAIFLPMILPTLRNAWIWNNSTQRNLVTNGTFIEPPEWNWQIEAADASSVKPQTEWQRTTVEKGFLRVWNPEAQNARLSVTQPLKLELPPVAMMRLRLVMQIRKHASLVCGESGEECPVMVRINYTDVSGKEHNWAQGFYANGRGNMGVPMICVPCENRAGHKRVALASWVTYESQDLFDVPTPQEMPRTLNSITVKFSGSAYDVLVARVNVLLRDGKPLDFRSRHHQRPRWDFRQAVPYWVWMFLDGRNRGGPFPMPAPRRVGPIEVQPMIPVPQPTLAPLPPKVP